MSSFNYLSDIEDCREMVEFLLSQDNKKVVVYYHELGPITSIRYNGFHFYLKYNKDSFARITQTKFIGDSLKAQEAFIELTNLISMKIGNPIAYYDMCFRENDASQINPTFEWCLDKSNINNYISSIENNYLFDDGSKCLNVKIFDINKENENKNALKLSLNK